MTPDMLQHCKDILAESMAAQVGGVHVPESQRMPTWAQIGRLEATLALCIQELEKAEASRSLLRTPSAHAPPGCHCQEKCMAPVVMGRQTECRDPEKAKRLEERK